MADVMSTLVWKLHQATGLEVYIAPKPQDAPVPCLTVQMISDPMQDSNHSAGASIHKSRIQIGHIGNYETIRPYVQTVSSFLEGNRSDFLSAMSDGVYLETKQAEDIWSLVKGYYVQWRY